MNKERRKKRKPITLQMRKRFELWGENSYVYFMLARVHGQPAIKIGYSWDPLLRSVAVSRQVGFDTEVLTAIHCEGSWESRALEKDLHRKFSEFRIQDEWFSPSAPLLEFIDKAHQIEVSGG